MTYIFFFLLGFPPQTPRSALCDRSGQPTAWNASSGRRDAGRQQPVRTAAPRPAEEDHL